MKKLQFLVVIFCLFSLQIFSQAGKVISPQEYENLKAKKQLDANTQYFISPTKDLNLNDQQLKQNDKAYTVNRTQNAQCECMLPVDGTFSVVPFSGYSAPDYRNDDASTTQISIPFSFCMYGTQYNALYINNNGNISFGSSYSTFSSSPFPSSSYSMVAPFWGDVDTRDLGSGLVYYKLTSNYLIVRWETVGYYSSYSDKLNDFQLIISDGTDTLIPGSNNIAFCYGDMQWTTGDASSGVNGFGGVPSTVGINKGDGTNFIQLGRFDQPGTAYDGAYGNPDGVDWLDNQTFYFDVCGSASNLPPLILTANAYSCVPDTILLCTNSDTLIGHIDFSGPENGQTVTASVAAPTLPGSLSTSTSTANGITTITYTLIVNPSQVGTHTVTITGTDNGTPNLSTSISYVVEVPNITLPAPVLAVNPTGIVCGNVGATVSLNNCAQYTDMIWSDGTQDSCSIQVYTTSTPYVTVIASNGCTKTSSLNVTVAPVPEPTITGNLNFCNNNNTTLNSTVTGSTAPITNYSWSIAGAGNNPTAVASVAGQVILTVTDSNGCIGDDTVTVTNITPTVNITPSTTSFCPGVAVNLASSITSGGATYTWTSNPSGSYPNTNTITVNPAVATTYSLSVVENGCTSNATLNLNPLSAASINSINNPVVCFGQVPTLTANVNPGGANVTWIPSNGGPTLTGTSITGTPGVTYTVQATVSGLCASPDSIVTANAVSPAINVDIMDTDPSPYDTIFCYKSTKWLTETVSGGTSPFTYQWSPASGSNSTNDTCKITLAGEYFLTVTDANGCIGQDSIELDLVQPILTLSGQSQICDIPIDTSRIIATGSTPNGFTISWNPASFGNNDTIYTTQSGQYTATITDVLYGCTETKIYNVNYFPTPTANFTVDPVISEVDIPSLFLSTSTVTSGSVTACYWNFGDNQTASAAAIQIHTYEAPGTYPVQLVVQTNKGCIDTVIIEHEVIAVVPIVNIITPNGDNVNNALYFKNLKFFPGSTLKIFNRWGNKIYESDNYDNKWNGDGHEDGTYYYILEVPGLHPQDNKITSFFQIIR